MRKRKEAATIRYRVTTSGAYGRMSLAPCCALLTLQHRPIRLVKEASYYEKETVENEAALQKMKDDNKGESTFYLPRQCRSVAADF